jgi:NADH-quinone oxidoreductase subunit C
MDRAELISLISSRLGSALLSAAEMKNDDTLLVVDRKELVSAVGTLKNDPALGFSTLMNHLGADYRDKLAVIYNLWSPSLRKKITVKAYVDRNDPEAPSLERAFHGISWYERETYDLLGIRFTGHSNLTRLLLPDDWEGHPLRKDYVYPASYHGIETGRPDLLDEPASPEGTGV